MCRGVAADGSQVRTTPERSRGRSRGRLSPFLLALPVALAVAIASAAPVGATAGGSAAQATTPAPKAGRHHRHKPKHKVHKVVKPDVPKVTPGPAALPAPAALAACADTELVPAPENVDRLAAAILCLVNQERAVAGVGQVRPVATMTAAARAHSVEMVAENYLAQVSPENAALSRG